jgi:N-succinyldiaminopimelate aminotransferase
VPELVRAIAAHQRRHYGLDLAPDQVVVTTGATEAIAAAVLGLVDPGDEVVVLEPYYDSYRAMLQFAGAVRRPVTLRAPDYRLDLAELEAAVTPRTRLILLNTPHNPTGRVLDRAELEGVADVARRHDLVVVTDEVYEHLVFDDHEHVPIATLRGMFERTVTISSSGKTFSLTGWKIGWATGPADLVAAVEGAKNWLSYSSGAPFQPAIAHALDHEEGFHRDLRDSLSRRRDHLCAALAGLGLGVHPPQGTYFVTTDVSSLGWADGRAFCDGLPDRAGVVAIPSMAFYEEGSAEGRHLVRWAFCKEQDVIDESVRRLAAADLHA